MEHSENKFKNALHTILKGLIQQKSLRDKINFTAYQLAKELGMPRSVISSLTHPDESKRASDPRVSTLIKIVDYFRTEGFDISIESILGRKPIEIKVENRSYDSLSLKVKKPSIDDKYGLPWPHPESEIYFMC